MHPFIQRQCNEASSFLNTNFIHFVQDMFHSIFELTRTRRYKYYMWMNSKIYMIALCQNTGLFLFFLSFSIIMFNPVHWAMTHSLWLASCFVAAVLYQPAVNRHKITQHCTFRWVTWEDLKNLWRRVTGQMISTADSAYKLTLIC